MECYVCGGKDHIATECPSVAEPEALRTTELPGNSRMVELYGDLMTSPHSLCHCVSECLSMGKGIAVLFKQQFGRLDELRAQHVAVGGVAVLPLPGSARRFVYYLITKPRFNDKPTYDSLAASLGAMFSHMHSNGVTHVSMPEIGCGLDGLKWSLVSDMVQQMIAGSGITVSVYHFKPSKQLHSRTKYQ